MKKIGMLIVVVFFCHFTQAQNNLQFNRVVYLDADTSLACSTSGACGDTLLMRTITVPQGKTLKVESVNFRTTYTYLLYLNLTPFGSNSTSGIGNFSPAANFPIWLPPGTHRIYFYAKNNPSNISFNFKFSYALSGLEFNVVN